MDNSQLILQYIQEMLDLHERAPLGFAQRRKLAMRMKRMAQINARKRKLAMHRSADPKRINRRARHAAVVAIRKRVAGAQGLKYSQLSPSQKSQIDKRVYARGPKMIAAYARRLTPMIRKRQSQRMSRRGSK